MVLFFYLGLLLVGIGALLGGLVAVLLTGPTTKPEPANATSDPDDAKDGTAPDGVPGPPAGSP